MATHFAYATAAAAALGVWAAHFAFHRRLAALLAEVQLEADQAWDQSLESSDQHAQEAQRMDEVPTCVREYLQHAAHGSRPVRLVKAEQRLQLRFKPGGPWKVAPGMLHLCARLPAFFFRGRVSMAPGVWVEGTECLVRGRGRMEWRLWGALQVASMRGDLLDRAARVRWLAEAVACPDSLRPSSFLRWEAVEGRPDQGRAVVSHLGVGVSGVFTFGEGHSVVGFRSDDYARAQGGRPVRCGMVGRCWNHARLSLAPDAGDVVVPLQTEAAFIGAQGLEEEAYVRVQLERLTAEWRP